MIRKIKNKIIIIIQKAKKRGYNYEYHFKDSKGKEFIEIEPKRYMRILSKISI
jgi:hypothetical protein